MEYTNNPASFGAISQVATDLVKTKQVLQNTVIKLEQFKLREQIKEEYPDAVHNIRAAANLFNSAITEIDCNLLSQLTDQSSSNIQDELNALAELLTVHSSDYITSILLQLTKPLPAPPSLVPSKEVENDSTVSN